MYFRTDRHRVLLPKLNQFVEMASSKGMKNVMLHIFLMELPPIQIELTPAAPSSVNSNQVYVVPISIIYAARTVNQDLLAAFAARLIQILVEELCTVMDVRLIVPRLQTQFLERNASTMEFAPMVFVKVLAKGKEKYHAFAMKKRSNFVSVAVEVQVQTPLVPL